MRCKPLFEHEMPNGKNQEWVWEVFRPYADDSFQAVREGGDDWHSNMSEWGRGRVEPGDEAMCIASFIWGRIRERFLGSEFVQPRRQLGIRMAIISDALAVRFKRLNSDRMVSPSKSDQSDAWWNNEPIDGFPQHLIRVTVGHTFDGENIDRVYLTWQPSKCQFGWAIELRGDASDGAAPVQFAPPTGPNIPMIPIIPREGAGKIVEEGAG